MGIELSKKKIDYKIGFCYCKIIQCAIFEFIFIRLIFEFHGRLDAYIKGMHVPQFDFKAIHLGLHEMRNVFKRTLHFFHFTKFLQKNRNNNPYKMEIPFGSEEAG